MPMVARAVYLVISQSYVLYIKRRRVMGNIEVLMRGGNCFLDDNDDGGGFCPRATPSRETGK